jgi:tetratricopeptide (TPR) repeat protein
LFAASTVLATVTDADKREMLNKYEAAMAKGDQVKAVTYLLDFTEEAVGENDPATVKLMHRLGHVLYENGKYQEATRVLKEALERSDAAFGETGGESFEISMNIGYAYSRWSPSLSNRMKYFDHALEILRERGEHVSVDYVTTLINITVNLMGGEGMKGEYTANPDDYFDSLDRDDGSFYFASVGQEYTSYFHLAKKYVLEAAEVAEKLETEDEYLSAKVAILQAKLNVMETADLDSVPMGVSGYISGGTANENYAREDDRLVTAIDKLAEDTDANKIFLETANKVRMEIAWLGKDGTRMATMCADGTLDSLNDYPADRIYEVTPEGVVIAPDVSMGVPRKLFNPIRVKRNSKGERIKRPHFVPVCIDGQLMAALSHVPKVTIEEVRRPASRPRSGRR